MKGYVKNTSQEGRILKLLRDKGISGVSVPELNSSTEGLGIAQYNARIFGLRHKGYNIVNDPIGHFTLIETEETRPKNYTFNPVTNSYEI